MLKATLPQEGTLLEVASGTGQHAAFFAGQFPSLTWQPSDGDPAALSSIAAWRDDAQHSNLREPLHLDVTQEPWPLDRADAVFCANMIHISPWTTCLGLITGAAKILTADAPLILYGPYRVEGTPTAPSNEAFDRSLRARDPRWGLRALTEVTEVATKAGFVREQIVEMPANNLSVVFRRLDRNI